MDLTEIQKILLSRQAIVIYEIVILAALLAVIVLLSKKRKQEKKQKELSKAQQGKQMLEDALTNQKRRGRQ